MFLRSITALLCAVALSCAASAADAPVTEATVVEAAPAPATTAPTETATTEPAVEPTTEPEAPLARTGAKIGVVMTAVPEVKVNIWGAGCLLCYATASAANSSLSKHSKSLTAEDIPQLKQMVAERVRSLGFEVVLIDEPIDPSKLKKVKVPKKKKAKKGAPVEPKGPEIAPRDYSVYKQSHGVDQLLVIELSEVGFHRTYSAYVPTSDPKAAVIGSSYMVDLADGTYAWQHPVRVMKSAESTWDEAPTFPGLTNAYYQALELAKDAFLGRIHL